MALWSLVDRRLVDRDAGHCSRAGSRRAKLQLAVRREDAFGEASDGERGGRSRERGGDGHVCRPIGSWVDAGCRHRRRSRPEVVRDQRVESQAPSMMPSGDSHDLSDMGRTDRLLHAALCEDRGADTIGAGWLDRRGHLRLAHAGQLGLGRAASSTSSVLVDDQRRARTPDLFWALAASWRPQRYCLRGCPDPTGPTTTGPTSSAVPIWIFQDGRSARRTCGVGGHRNLPAGSQQSRRCPLTAISSRRVLAAGDATAVPRCRPRPAHRGRCPTAIWPRVRWQVAPAVVQPEPSIRRARGTEQRSLLGCRERHSAGL